MAWHHQSVPYGHRFRGLIAMSTHTNKVSPAQRPGQKIAVIGSGISGLTAAHMIAADHQVTVFEAADYIGGHTNTINLGPEHGGLAVDTGFIVFNDWTYPNFIKLMGQLGVESQKSDMSFSVKCEKSGLEYNGTNINSLFAQRRNLLRPSFHQMIRDILRFNKESLRLLDRPEDDGQTLGDYLAENRYSRQFIRHYIVPMGSAIWSTGERGMDIFPARYFVRFFKNHGMLSVNERPQWRVINGGSQRYVEVLARPLAGSVRLNTPVVGVERSSEGVRIRVRGNDEPESFDQVIFACHSDQALAILGDPTAAEREILGAIPYSPNEATLHTDARVMPRRKLAWASWNYHIRNDNRGDERVAVTYNMNILQSLPARKTFLVSLNSDDAIDDRHAIKKILYHHPAYTVDSIRAQRRHGEISGAAENLGGRTHFCGAYWGFGFHEDGVKSGVAVAKAFGKTL